MRVNFYVYNFEKEKCEFIFTYIKSELRYISGTVAINLNSCPLKATFDAESEKLLEEKEKRGIISEVLTNLKLN